MKGIDVYVEEAVQNRGVSVLRVSGYVDTTTSPDLERRLQALLRENRFHIVVDLSGVEYISSAGWGIFISEIREIREQGGDLKLAGMIPDVREVFDLLEFENILKSYPDTEMAVGSFGAVAAAPPSSSTGGASGSGSSHSKRASGGSSDRDRSLRRGPDPRDRAPASRVRSDANPERASQARARRPRPESGPDLRAPAKARPRHARAPRGPRQGKPAQQAALNQNRLTAGGRVPIV